MLKSLYRREPILGFFVTIGLVDVLLGGIHDRGSLLWFGIGMAALGIALRWWQAYREVQTFEADNRPPSYMLPPKSSSSSLPMLSMSKKQPPGRF